MTNHNQTHGLEALNGTDSKTQNSDVSSGLDTVFALLKCGRRREILRVLHENGSMPKRDLVNLVAASEPDKDPHDEDWSDKRHTVYVSLQQTHLPRLEKAGVIEWERDMIRIGPNAETVYRFANPLFGTTEEGEEETETPEEPKGLGSRLKDSMAVFS